MAEKTEDPAVEPGAEPQEPEPGTPQEPAVPEPTPEPQVQIDPFAGTPYEGKTPAEIKGILEEKERFIQDRNNELGQARNDIAYLRSQQQPQEPQKPQVDFEDLDQRFLTNPAKTTMGLMDEKFNQYGMQNQYQQAQILAPMVEQQARNSYGIFKRLSDEQQGEVRRYMMATTDPRSGMSPNFALSPEAWANAASMVWAKAHNYDIPQSAPKAPAPPPLETPQGTKPKTEKSRLEEVPQQYREIWAQHGYTEEQQERMAKTYLEGEK